MKNSEILFSDITIIDENFQCRENMFVGVKDGKIAYIGTEIPKENYKEVYNGQGKLLSPALVNAHTHLSMSLMRGYGENLSLQDWLNTAIFPFEDCMEGEDFYAGAMLSLAEMIQYGSVLCADMYFNPQNVLRAVEDSKAKVNFSDCVTTFGNDGYYGSRKNKENDELIAKYKNNPSDRIFVETSLHAEYTNTEKGARELIEYANEHNLGMHIHMSETKKEHLEAMERRNGMTPVQFFHSLGAFNTRVNIAHGVWLSDEDLDIIKDNNASISLNPISNLKLASGVSPIGKFLDKGINLALGTDSVASNNTMNLFEEVKSTATLHKGVWGDPTLVTPEQVYYMATRGGALALGRNNTGLIKEGFDADLIIMDISGPAYFPSHNLLANIVYAGNGRDVIMTMANGTILYENGEFKTIDLEKAKHDVQKSIDKILGKLNK